MKDSDPIDLETEDLSEEEFNLLTLNCAFEDDESEDKIWEKYLTSESFHDLREIIKEKTSSLWLIKCHSSLTRMALS